MSGDKVDFRFSHFKVSQVPKGWDNLFVSLVSLESGKTLARSSKAFVRNGTCKWPEATTESVFIPQEDSFENLEDRLFKFVVAMGSARYGILGEATVNATSYITSGASIPISLPLKKCNHGTVLQLKIQCLTPRTDLRDIRSEVSESTLAKKVVPPSKYLASTLDSEERRKSETNLSALGSHYRNDSADYSTGRGNSTRDNEGHGLITRQDSISSQDSAPCSSHSNDSPSRSNSSSHSQCSPRDFAPSSLGITGSSKDLVQPSGNTIEEIQVEAKMWERNARRLMLDLDVLRKECSDQSKSLESLDIELSAACAERDGLRKEIEHLKAELEAKQTEIETIRGDEKNVQKELENEIKFQKESNANLALQLKRSQVSNVELVSAIKEMEETIEGQKIQIENFSAFQSRISEMENSIQYQEEENAKLLLQLQQLGESEKRLQSKVQLLEQALDHKNIDMKREFRQRSNLAIGNCIAMEAANRADADLIKEMESLKEKVHELEGDCKELTDENLDLLFKLKQTKESPSGEGASFGFPSTDSSDLSSTNSDSDFGGKKSRVQHLREKLKKKLPMDLENKYYSAKLELEAKLSELGKELTGERSKMKELKDMLMSKEGQIELLRQHISRLEPQVSNLRREKDEMEKRMQHLRREKSEIELQCSEMKKEKVELTASISRLETQLSCFVGEKESCQSELQKFKSLSLSLQDEIAKLKNGKESYSKDLEIKLQNMQNRLSKTQEECEYLRKANTKLQASAQSLAEECNSLQKSKGELEKQKREILERYNDLEMTRKEKTQKQRKGESGNGFDYEDLFSKIHMLEDELAQAKEANNMYKVQLERLFSQDQKRGRDEVVRKDKYESIISSLEAELKDIHERYLEMSLKYAEVEAQREELVMKLKAAKNGRSWFS